MILNRKQIAIVLGIVCFLLVIGIVIQAKTVNNANKVASASLTDNVLRDQVLKLKEKYDETYELLQTAEQRLEEIRQKSTENNSDSIDKNKQIKKNNMMLGLTNVEGEGVIVTLKDDNNATVSSISKTDDISYHLVHEQDIRQVINELENAGAEAISVNGQRIVSTSSINCEGNVISINGQKVASPFVISAIGNSFVMNSSLSRPGGTIELFNETGLITTIKTSNNVSVPKFSGVISSKYIQYQE